METQPSTRTRRLLVLLASCAWLATVVVTGVLEAITGTPLHRAVFETTFQGGSLLLLALADRITQPPWWRRALPWLLLSFAAYVIVSGWHFQAGFSLVTHYLRLVPVLVGWIARAWISIQKPKSRPRVGAA